MTILLLTLVASLAALVGGTVALRSRTQLHLAMALTSGLVLGLVAFDLLPEIFEGIAAAGIDAAMPMVLFISGFLLFHIVEKLILVHEGAEEQYGPHTHPKLGIARALALTGHSFLDGLSIGVGFQVSNAVGYAVALAVIGHRFADGFDTANFMILHKNSERHIRQFMAIVIAMPILGGLASLVISFSETTLTLYLSLFAGILMYIAASNILPQAHTKKASYRALGCTLIGTVAMFVITRFIG
ncbi:ZIP family metal transporter [Candidatus Saccharibacteria bacterium]|nr:ZIP family metal transporter [Candidatus Saccharibacteria bacterium]